MSEGGAVRSIASLLASGTEIVCALGLRERLVGISHECDYPPDVRGLPVLTAPRVDPRAPSAAIDRAVNESVAAGLSLYEIRAERLRALAPDLIVTQDQCHVCAVTLEQVEREVSGLLGKPSRVVSLSPRTLDGAFDDLLRVAEAAGVPEAGRRLRSGLRARLDRLASRANCSTGHLDRRPGVLCLEWLDPPFLSGNWMPALVEAAGGDLVPAEEGGKGAGSSSPRTSWEDVAAARPDFIVLMPCGFDLERTLAEAPAALGRREVRGTPAFRGGQIWAVDGSAYFNRSGPRLVESAEILASILHPQTFGPPPAQAARRLPAGASGPAPSSRGC